MTSNFTRFRTLFHEYRALLILGSAALLAELAYAILNLSAMPIYVAKGLNEGAHLGLIGGTFLAVEALSRPALGALGDRIGRKPLMLAGPALTAVTAYLTILYCGPLVVPFLVALRAIDGLGSSAMWMNAFAAVGDVVGEKHRSAAMSVLNVTYMGGMALAFLFGGRANDHFHSLKASFYLSSLLFVLSFIVLLIFFPRTGKPHHVDIPGHETPMNFKPSDIIRSFKDVPDMIVMAIVTFLGMGMLTLIIKLYAYDHLGLSETSFGLYVAPIAIIMGVCAVPLGHLGDRFGKTTAVCWGLFASSVAMWMIALSKDLYIVGIAGILIGVGFTIAFPAWNALVLASTDPRRRGEVLGAVGLAQGLAAMLGTLMGPYIYYSDALSLPQLGIVNYNVPFWLSAILISAGTMICFTWVANKRVVPGSDERITRRQRQTVIVLAILGFSCFAGWIGWRYTMPVPPNRVAWSWVQQLARNKPQKAMKFALTQATDWNGPQAARARTKEYYPWVYKQHASYQVEAPEYRNDDVAQVQVKFNLPDKEPIYRTIQLCKTKPRGEWKVCGDSQFVKTNNSN